MEEARLIPRDEKTPEQIQAEMVETRESLTEKVAVLEDEVIGSIQTATDALASIKSFVTAAPAAVSETVKHGTDAIGHKMREFFAVSDHVKNYPWVAVGAAALLGCLTSWFIFREPRAREPRQSTPPPPPTSSARSAGGVFDETLDLLGRKLREISENAIEAAAHAVNRNVREGMPKLIDAAADALTPAA